MGAIIYKKRKHGTVGNFPRGGQPIKSFQVVHQWHIQKVRKEPGTASKAPQASLDQVKVGVHDSKVRKKMSRKSLLIQVFIKEHKGLLHICKKKISWWL